MQDGEAGRWRGKDAGPVIGRGSCLTCASSGWDHAGTSYVAHGFDSPHVNCDPATLIFRSSCGSFVLWQAP